ncbi:exo-alpha-sialidase [Ideonella azotifigens]|uniref:Exo-alpha-sialidase n=1 Tax=Ideonella azotifigens TaxID=513160 RepID=A0ABP3V4T7_9BURK|nr:exo-alpha-sialidase [Ideonella azotifigens]MCD2341242.1 exo-alpha-sialidase [Ideonella azotifigens]
MDDRAWVATRKGLFELRLRAGAWAVERASFVGDPVSNVLPPDASGHMLAALHLGHFGVKLHRSDDAGASWHEVDAPSLPAQPSDAEGPPWKVTMVWSLERAGASIFAGTLPGALFRSGDGGASWQLEQALWQRPERPSWTGGGYDQPGIHSICPQPGGTLLVGVSCAGAWLTQDDGASWRQAAHGMRADFMPPDQAFNPEVQDPHAIVRCAAAPDVLWCQHHNGIFRSTNGGTQWTEITAPLSVFGFAVAAHPLDPQTAWFVPAVKDQCRVPVNGALVVNRTRDGGASFETLRAGLPQQDCYDLMYRHGLAVDSRGQGLLMGSTTGGLWASHDSGDQWAALPARLPPVYAVRFG